jgi:hypothetical protein
MSRWFLTIFCFLAAMSVPYLGIAQKHETAIEQFKSLREKANAARKSGDKPARLAAVLELQKLLNDSPDVVEAAAKAYSEVGDTEHALASLMAFAEQGQVDESLLSGGNSTFSALEKSPRYQSILNRFKENKSPIGLGESVSTLSDPGLLAEDIVYDAGSRTFLITSVLEKKIVRVDPDGKVQDFAASPSHWPMLAIKVDAAHRRVWATEVALRGFTIAPKSDWGHSALLCFNLASGRLERRIEGPANTALGDLVLTSGGTPIVSDGEGGGIYRVNGERLERIDGGDFISPQTATMHPDGKHLFIPDYVRGIGLLDLTSKHVIWLDQGGKTQHALNGIDGLYFDRGFLIATQNGSSPERVIRFRLNAERTGIVSERIIERLTATLGDPTHGVIVGDFFYYIANSGWDVLDDHGDLKSGAKLTPARIMRFRVDKPNYKTGVSR